MRFLLGLGAVVWAGCIGGDPNPMVMPDGGDDDGTSPVAKAGADRAVHTTTAVALDGAESSTPRGTALSYDWRLVMRPTDSKAALSADDQATTSFTPDRDGTYVVRLVVDDGTASSRPDEVVVVASNAGPTAHVSADVHVYTGGTVTPTGAASTDPDGDPLTYSWSLSQRPAVSSAAISGADSVTPALVPDVDGTYVMSLVVTDPAGAVSLADHVVVKSWHPLRDLAYVVEDAEHSTAQNKLVLLSGSTLHIVDPSTGAETTVLLTHPGTAVSVSPDGAYAAVGHDGWLSYVRLSDATLLATHAVSALAHDVVLAGNGFAYVFPRVDSLARLRSIRLSDGQETLASGIPQRTVARLHPNGTTMYGATNDVIPTDIEKYSLGTGTASKLYDSPYHGDYPMCGDLWIGDDGERVVTRCGRTFWATSSQLTDLYYAGALDAAWIRHADHNSFAARYAAIPAAFDSGGTGTVRLYHDDTLAFEKVLGPTMFMRDGARKLALVRFVFFSPAGDKLYLVTEPETGGGPGGLVTYVR